MTEVQHVIKIADMPDDMVSDAIEIAGVSSLSKPLVVESVKTHVDRKRYCQLHKKRI